MERTPYHTLMRTGATPAELISLAEAKLYLRIDHSEDDLFISESIVAVRHYAERYTGRSLVTQDWLVTYRDCVPSELTLPMPPIQSVTSITLTDADGNDTVVDSSNYRLVTSQVLALDTAFAATLISIVFTAGESATEATALKQAMFSHIAVQYDHRSHQAPLPESLRTLYDGHREIRV